jgi:hypothetical protein
MANELCDYALLFARERDAWALLMASKVNGQYDPLLMFDWAEASRLCATRSDTTSPPIDGPWHPLKPSMTVQGSRSAWPSGLNRDAGAARWGISHPRAGTILSPADSALAHRPEVDSKAPSAASAHVNESDVKDGKK